jgi:hypothetical protein
MEKTMKTIKFKLVAFTALSLASTAVLAKNKWLDVTIVSTTETAQNVAEWFCQMTPCCW